MAKKKRIKIGAMYREYGKYEVCGLYNTPIDEKYKPIFKGANE